MAQLPEMCSIEPENYKKYFRSTYWNGSRKVEKRHKNKLGRREKVQRIKVVTNLTVCNAPCLLANASEFAAFATVRRAVLFRWKLLPTYTCDLSDESDTEEQSNPAPTVKLPKITGIGLKTVFTLISQSRDNNPELCEQALQALLDILQGHGPEQLQQEPDEIISNLHTMLVEVAAGNKTGPNAESPTKLTALSSSCLIALSVARGEAELILNAVASLTMSPTSLSNQYVQIPSNVITLQRSVQSHILGTPSRNLWLNFGVPNQSLVTSFPVDLPSQLTSGNDLIVRSLVSDGGFLYVYSSKGLLKIGSGYGSSIKQHVYLYKPDFFSSDRHGWLGYCKNKLYVRIGRIGRKKTDIYEVDKDTLEVKSIIRMDPGSPAPIESKAAVFSDGNQLGLITLSNHDTLSIKFYDVDTVSEVQDGTSILTSNKELSVNLLRRRTVALGRAPFEEVGGRNRSLESDMPIAMQLEDCDEDPLMSICTGQDFGLLTTASGKVYYTGKATSLGYKVTSPQLCRWNLMKETIFSKNDSSNSKRSKVLQIALGHEGVHAILVLDNGSALFTGIARRGEDGDSTKHRRTPKPTRPKKMLKAEGHHIVYAACNYGSTALVTRQGLLLMFGKDTQHCDATGVVTGLRHERVVQVALGKAHAVALTNFGQVYTFGINNKGQCGREFGYTKEKPSNMRRQPSTNHEETRLCLATQHTWTTDYCRICVLCHECTGFASACKCANFTKRVPREKCGCGEGDSGCTACGVCRRCAEAFAVAAANRPDTDDEPDSLVGTDAREEQTNLNYEGSSVLEPERDASVKVTCLPPSRVAVPGGHKVSSVAAGLHHTVLLTEHGDVLVFGSNQYGQLGAGDLATHHRIIRVKVPRCSAIAAGSNHTAVLTRDGEIYSFGYNQKGSLGRSRLEEILCTDRSVAWYASPGRVPRLGPRQACKAVWVSACGDQTFLQVSQALIKTDTLFSSTIAANNSTIVILPNRPEHQFKCITINKTDGSCNAWTGPEQVDFVNSLACLDPLYDVLWCYNPQMRVMKCYNILAYDSHKYQKCCNVDPDNEYGADNDYEYPNYGSMKRMEDFKNLESIDVLCNTEEKQIENVALTNMSILNQELAIPCVPDCSVTRIHISLHLLACLDSLTYCHDSKLCQMEGKKEVVMSTLIPLKEDFLTVNRFESHGGGWGYSGHSVEAIRFMCDTDILMGGYGLFGGRGDYTAKIKLFDLGPEGGDQEGDGEILAESEDIVFECPPRDKFPVLFDASVPVLANRWYVAWACINGPSSDCGSSGQAMVIHEEVGFHFKTSKKSNNGTDVNAGQIPCLYYNIATSDSLAPIRCLDIGDPIITLSRNISRKVTIACFKSLIKLLQWSWDTFKTILMDTNGQIPINYQKLTVMKHQKRLVYVIKACLRLTKSYINEVYPQNSKKRTSHEYMSYFEAIAEVRNLIQSILADPTPTCAMLPRKPGKNKAHRVCYVQFALEMTNAILNECHETITSCFHAFFPTPTLKWHHLCSLVHKVQDGVVPANQVRELTSTCSAMCISRSLRDVLHYVVPLTQSSLTSHETRRRESRVKSEVPSRSATVPRTNSQKPPPIPPRACNRDQTARQLESVEMRSNYTDWHLMDLLPRLLDIVMNPVKQQMMTRQCGQPHDHGEIKLNKRLSNYCCKLVSRIVAELSYGVNNIRDDIEMNSSVKNMSTPSRFMRVNQARAWNTGNGSPDAICFMVDRPGVLLTGVMVYGGLGHYEYELELLHDVRIRSANDEGNLSHCWVSLDVTHGSFSAADCQHEMVQVKFERPIPLKEDVRYAIRLCNHGSRTVNGDCGLPSVKGPDGTTFRFASCSLSFNGTSLARGQIPCLMYYGSTKQVSNSSENSDSMLTSLRYITMRVASLVMQRSADLFCELRNELTAEDLRRNASVLQQSPAINTLIPFTLASLEGLGDSKSVVQLLEMIHKLLPHVAALNLLLPNTEEGSGRPANTTGHYYTWVESEHPYKPATVTNTRVLFASNVSWMLVEIDPRSITAQPEDTLTIYGVAGAPKKKCRCSTESKINRPPFRKRFINFAHEGSDVEELCDDSEDLTCLHYNCSYLAITPKLSNVPSDWPQRSIMVPGNELIFSLETSSDYLNDYNKSNSDESRFGFRCLCVGYEESAFTSQRQGLLTLEMELAYSGGLCATRLLGPEIDVPPLAHSTIMDVLVSSLSDEAATNGQDKAAKVDCEALLLSRGLELSSPPTIHQILDGQPLVRNVSTERQFLSDFVSGIESTAGGRLARWLSPAPCVEASRCELKHSGQVVRPGNKLALPVLLRDQYGDLVASPALVVEVVVQKAEDGVDRRGRSSLLAESKNMVVPDAPYQFSVRDTMRFHAITMMKGYQGISFEELRFASGAWGGFGNGIGAGFNGRAPAERLSVQMMADGTYAATWTPRAAGIYNLRCSLDDHPLKQELVIEVIDNVEGPAERGVQAGGATTPLPPARMRRFEALYSAGLRIRASPSLQAEELGRIPHGANIAFVEEVVNKDGTWLRLNGDSMRAFADTSATVAWCLQYHRHLDRVLLLPVQSEYGQAWVNFGEEGDVNNWNNDEEAENTAKDVNNPEERKFLFNIQSDSPNESDGSSSPIIFGPEPSKRGRLARDEPMNQAPRRLQRRSNGNGGGDEWWTPEKYRSSENVRDSNVGSEVDQVSSGQAQAGTQTSPDNNQEDNTPSQFYIGMPPAQDDRTSPRSVARERIERRSRAYKRTASPPHPAPAPAPQPPRKYALSPSQAECIRAVFAALLWHEGLVYDAITSAAFLKFHPQLPKQGATVVTRGSAHEVPPRPQRHSVEVTSAGQYLSIQPSTLESLTRSGAEASASRARKNVADSGPPPISEEDTHSDANTAERPRPSSVINVLPITLRAIANIWDSLVEADQLAVATDKFKKENSETIENDTEQRSSSGIRKKRDWKSMPGSKTPYSVRCELCSGANVPPPLAAHMRHCHPGCRTPTARGYDRAGVYRKAEALPPPVTGAAAPACGQLAQTYHLWYIFCEKCRDKALKSATTCKQPKQKMIVEWQMDRLEVTSEIDHHVMKENALFLLDLAPMTSTESSMSSWLSSSSRSPPTPPGSPWQPAPPFQCLPALGAGPPAAQPDRARYHSLGRPQPPAASATAVAAGYSAGEPMTGTQYPRVHRSISMGQAGVKNLAAAAKPPPPLQNNKGSGDIHDILSGSGSALLAQPSASLQRVISSRSLPKGVCSSASDEQPMLDPNELMRRPCLDFVLARRDLHTLRQKMDATVRINTFRQYAFEALNWLLRSVTQPTCVHDIMWWFCDTLEKYAIFIPQSAAEDLKEGAPTEGHRPALATPSTSVLCPGGKAARGARMAFHAFLGSVSALAPSLPPASAAALQAVRCWALHYTQHDRAFLHRSQVFTVISKILSHSDDGAYENGIVGALHESMHSFFNKDSYVWTCPDITSWCDVTVSSRQGMAGALVDGSTETFWESGDEDRNKAKWIQVAYPGGTDDLPHLICLHIDNTRDTVNKTLLVSFLYSGGTSEMFHMQDIDVDSKSSAWICYSLPRLTCAPMRVRCELRGPEPAVRVRQIRILSAPMPSTAEYTLSPAQILSILTEADTMRVFRLLTTQVFGKLLRWGRDATEGSTALPELAPLDENADSDLREHIVGILFAGHQLTSLQRQVMSHIVRAIGCEALKIRDEWETIQLCAEVAKLPPHKDLPKFRLPAVPFPDNYCFEMLSLLLALSGSRVGRAHLSQRTELLSDLLALLHTASDRVQRQVISMLRRMILEVPPQKMITAINSDNESVLRITLLDHLMIYLSKAISLQVKVKGNASSAPISVTLGSSIPYKEFDLWFMRGDTTNKHAQLVAQLIIDMSEDKLGPVWGSDTRALLAFYMTRLAMLSDSERVASNCVTLSTLWMALAALCVCQPSQLDALNTSREGRGRESSGEARPFCANHDDGATVAVVECRTCGALCSECDRFLHLKRAAKTHQRKICKEEESAIRIDIHEGCGRAKLFWLLLLVDRRTLKALAEFREVDGGCDLSLEGATATGASTRLAGVCRFCGTRSNTGLLAIGNVCSDQECQEHGKEACTRVLPCGHQCGGVRAEHSCLPCLFGCASDADGAPLRQDADDMCMICFTDPLQAAPAIQLKCGHVFHLHCCKMVLANKWIGPRITFSFSQCPICKEDIVHWTLEELLAPIRRLREEVRRKALMRLEYEGLAANNARTRAGAAPDPAAYAMERYAYYVCHKCEKAYFGGLARCEAESSGWWDASELVCGACSDVAGARTCPKHGADFLEYKCRYCCSVAVFFCFGTSHFCNSCHDDFQRVTNIPRHLLPHCPAGPKGEQLAGTSDECPLHVQHPATGEEFALGCGVCRHAHAF